MTEDELIKKIKGLREIKPSKEWVFLTRSQILGEKPDRGGRASAISEVLRVFTYKPVLVPVLAVFVLIGLFILSQNSLPGDPLYSVKKLTEKGQAFFVSDGDKTKVQLEQVNSRLEDLTKIAEKNQVKKLAPAIDEFQKTLSQAAQNLKETKINKGIIDQTKKIVENKEKIEETLGVQIGETEELDNALKILVEREITNLEKMDLSLFSEEKVQLLEEAKKYYEAGNYSEALIKIWNLSQ